MTMRWVSNIMLALLVTTAAVSSEDDAFKFSMGAALGFIFGVDSRRVTRDRSQLP